MFGMQLYLFAQSIVQESQILMEQTRMLLLVIVPQDIHGMDQNASPIQLIATMLIMLMEQIRAEDVLA